MRSPTNEELNLIKSYLPTTEESSDLTGRFLVERFVLIDNLINHHFHKYSLDTLRQLVKVIPGIPLIFDHDQTKASQIMGTAISASLVTADKPPAGVIDATDRQSKKYNLEILRKERYQRVEALFYFSKDDPRISNIRDGLWKNISVTIAFPDDASNSFICPKCNIPFVNSECPHHPPARDRSEQVRVLKAMHPNLKEYQLDDLIAPYHEIRHPDIKAIELSFVVNPAIPASGLHTEKSILNSFNPTLDRHIQIINSKKLNIMTEDNKNQVTPDSQEQATPAPVANNSQADSEVFSAGLPVDINQLQQVVDYARRQGEEIAKDSYQKKVDEFEAQMKEHQEAYKAQMEKAKSTVENTQQQMDSLQQTNRTLMSLLEANSSGYLQGNKYMPGLTIPGVFKDASGPKAPGVMNNTYRDGYLPFGSEIINQLCGVYNNQCPEKEVLSKLNQTPRTNKFTEPLDQFVKNNRKEIYSAFDRILQDKGYHALMDTVNNTAAGGFGGFGGSVYNTGTSSATMPSMFLPVLSSLVRTTHDLSLNVLKQFADNIFRLDAAIAERIIVPRVAHLPQGETAEEYILTPGFRTAAGSSSVIATNAYIEMREWGRGARDYLQPVAVPDFAMQLTTAGLVQLAGDRLFRDYCLAIELAIYQVLAATTATVYNDDNQQLGLEGAANVNAGGTMTKEYLIWLGSYMHSELKIPTLSDGKYIIVLNGKAKAQLMTSMQEFYRVRSPGDLEAVTSILNATYNAEATTSPGYLGSYGMFHMYESSLFGAGGAGSRGVQSEVFGTGETLLTRDSYAFGNAVIGNVIATPFNIHMSSNTDFGRMMTLTWRSIQGIGALDVDPNSVNYPNDQQLRVLKVRNTDKSIA